MQARSLPRPTLSEARGLWVSLVPYAKHSPRLSAGLTTTGASPTHTIRSVSSTRCGCSFAPIYNHRTPTRSQQGATLQSSNYQHITRASAPNNRIEDAA
ncbi:MAG: hypothetical protein ACI31A_02315 [Candidatus Limisoma sp.]